MRDTLTAWEFAARHADYRRAIHPAGVDLLEYWRSGQDAARIVAELIGPARTVVDVGCGDGRVTLPLLAHYDRVVAVDASPTMLGRLPVHVEAHRSDGTNLEALNLHPDAFVFLAVLIHHRHEDTARILASAARALPAGGRAIVDLPLELESYEPAGWRDVARWTITELAAVTAPLGLHWTAPDQTPGALCPIRMVKDAD